MTTTSMQPTPISLSEVRRERFARRIARMTGPEFLDFITNDPEGKEISARLDRLAAPMLVRLHRADLIALIGETTGSYRAEGASLNLETLVQRVYDTLVVRAGPEKCLWAEAVLRTGFTARGEEPGYLRPKVWLLRLVQRAVRSIIQPVAGE